MSEDKNYELVNGVNIMSVESDEAKPATSCHVWWKSDCSKEDLEKEWVIRNSVEVKESFGCTYFCLAGFNCPGSGGYGGIQEQEDGRKLAIFSVWNSPTNKTEALEW